MKIMWTRSIGRLAMLPRNIQWVPAYVWQRVCREPPPRPFHLIIALVDHFEPYIIPERVRTFLSKPRQLERVRKWCQEYPITFHRFRDSSGVPFRHTYFYPAEHSDPEILAVLAEHCKRGWGEIEVHLHHGIDAPDTARNTRSVLVRFRDYLASIGCLSRLIGSGLPRYAFVHGNWALANSAKGSYCGVDSEMQILSQTGCYADFTLPSAPSRGQTSKINSLYECIDPLSDRAPHRRGRDLRCGVRPTVFPIIIQGPLMIDFAKSRRLFPALENSALTALNPPTLGRCQLWTRAAITVGGRPDWVFVKLHCHGMDPRDTNALLGKPMLNFLQELVLAEKRSEFITHFVTAREMTNIILAACDGRSGNPSTFRNSPFEMRG
jgi:hypothetical protein